MVEIDSKKMMESSSLMGRADMQLKQANNDIVKIGFMMILEKLENDRLHSFVNESHYLQEVIQRYVSIYAGRTTT